MNKLTIYERLLRGIQINEQTKCWEWQNAKLKSGYGIIQVKKAKLVHRVMYQEHYDVLIDSHEKVCHTCDNPPCINPDHLFLGTQKDNIQDELSKGRNCNTNKTHCPQGHEYTLANTYIYPNGWRKCRICRAEGMRK